MGKKSKKKLIIKGDTVPVNHNNGIKIHDTYRFKSDDVNYYVYEGLCDNIKTKWITKNKWDYKITICCDGVGLYPVDSKGDFITVLEKDDPYDIEKWNIVTR